MRTYGTPAEAIERFIRRLTVTLLYYHYVVDRHVLYCT
jgi:hypothetical protein